MSEAPGRFHNTRRVVANVFLIVSGSYGISVSALLLLRAVVGESWKIVALFNSYLHLLLIPSLFLLPITLLLRRWRLALVQLPPLLFFLAVYGTLFLPRTPPTAEDRANVRFLSYNLSKDNTTPDAVLQIIREADADIVALQELNPVMADALETFYPYHAFHPDVSYPGQGILSRYLIVEDEYWRIYLGHQRAVIDVNGVKIVLYNTHPIHPFIRERGFFDPVPRTEEVNEILPRAGGETMPVLIAGDFNMTDQTGDYARIAEQYADTYREIGWGMGFTFPDLGQRLLLAQLDYVFHSSHFVAVEARVWGTSGGSDHRPVYAVLGFKQG